MAHLPNDLAADLADLFHTRGVGDTSTQGASGGNPTMQCVAGLCEACCYVKGIVDPTQPTMGQEHADTLPNLTQPRRFSAWSR